MYKYAMTHCYDGEWFFWPRYTGRPDYLGLRQDEGTAQVEDGNGMEPNLMLQKLLYICGWVWSWGKYYLQVP